MRQYSMWYPPPSPWTGDDFTHSEKLPAARPSARFGRDVEVILRLCQAAQ